MSVSQRFFLCHESAGLVAVQETLLDNDPPSCDLVDPCHHAAVGLVEDNRVERRRKHEI
jgi:hypothetical protein